MNREGEKGSGRVVRLEGGRVVRWEGGRVVAGKVGG